MALTPKQITHGQRCRAFLFGFNGSSDEDVAKVNTICDSMNEEEKSLGYVGFFKCQSRLWQR